MNPLELIAGIGLTVVVVGLSVFFAWRQRRTLRALGRDRSLAPEDRRYLYRQALGRLFNSVLMLIFAALLVAGLFFFPAERGAQEPPQPPSDETKEAIRLSTSCLILALFVLLAIMAVAAVDLWATARFGLRHRRQLGQDRQALLAEEAAQRRQRRQEMN